MRNSGRSLRRKATRYGRMRVPFVIAASLHDVLDDIDIHNALPLGEEIFIARQDPGATSISGTPSRQPNGLWWGPRRPSEHKSERRIADHRTLPLVNHAVVPPPLAQPFGAIRSLPTDLLPISRDGAQQRDQALRAGNRKAFSGLTCLGCLLSGPEEGKHRLAQRP